MRVGLCEARVRGVGGACAAPPYVFGTFGARSECPRLRVGVCEARVRGVGGACGDPPYVFGTLGTRSECSRLRAGLCEERVWGIGGACGAPPYVFATLGTRPGCPRLYFGLEKPQFTRLPNFTPMGKKRLRWGGRTRRPPSRRRERSQTAAGAWQLSWAQPHSYSRTLRGKKSAPHAPHLTVGPFDPELIRPVDWLAVPVYSRVSFAGSSGASDLFRQRAPSVGAPGAILWPRHYRANTSKG